MKFLNKNKKRNTICSFNTLSDTSQIRMNRKTHGNGFKLTERCTLLLSDCRHLLKVVLVMEIRCNRWWAEMRHTDGYTLNSSRITLDSRPSIATSVDVEQFSNKVNLKRASETLFWFSVLVRRDHGSRATGLNVGKCHVIPNCHVCLHASIQSLSATHRNGYISFVYFSRFYTIYITWMEHVSRITTICVSDQFCTYALLSINSA